MGYASKINQNQFGVRAQTHTQAWGEKDCTGSVACLDNQSGGVGEVNMGSLELLSS